MSGPKRIQLKRTKGWRKPEGCITVARPSKWGNPFPLQGAWITWTAVSIGLTGDAAGRRAAAVLLHRAWITGEPVPIVTLRGEESGEQIEFTDGSVVGLTSRSRVIAAWAAAEAGGPWLPNIPDLGALRGHDLGCWCKPDLACHADTLIELANR